MRQSVEENQNKRNRTYITEEKKAQYEEILGHMEEPVILKIFLDDSALSKKLLDYMLEISGLSPMISIETKGLDKDKKVPAVYLCNYNGQWKGLSFHGVPEKYQLTAFIMGIYNASGKGQEISDETRTRIKAIKKKIRIRILVSLKCVSCPELVTAAQKIAALNTNVEAEVYDIAHFPELKERYQIKRVPCMVINEGNPMPGRKNLSEILKLVED